MTTDNGHQHAHDNVPEHAHDEAEQAQQQQQQFTPQPVPMGIAAGLVALGDGTDRVMVTYTSVNGSWTVFYDREGAIAHAQTLLGMAYQPPAQAPDTVPNAASQSAIEPPVAAE